MANSWYTATAMVVGDAVMFALADGVSAGSESGWNSRQSTVAYPKQMFDSSAQIPNSNSHVLAVQVHVLSAHSLFLKLLDGLHSFMLLR